MLDPGLCSDLCSAGRDTLQKIPRAAFDLTGVYVDPATAAVVTGLVFLMQKSQTEATFYLTKEEEEKRKIAILKVKSRKKTSIQNQYRGNPRTFFKLENVIALLWKIIIIN